MAHQAGQVFGDYRILDPIGSGGMGEVYLAEHAHLRKHYALKVLPATRSLEPALVDRFHAEARVMADLSHPHIVPVHNMGVASGVYYLVMDYVTGPDGVPLTLEDLRRREPKERLDESRVRLWALQVCSALAYAHKRGVIHQDLKPANVLIDADGNARLTDFGLAKLVRENLGASPAAGARGAGGGVSGDTDPGATMGPGAGDRSVVSPGSGKGAGDTLYGGERDEPSSPSSPLGTYDYMSPEQRGEFGGVVDQRSDIYSFGVMIYQLLTGRRPVGLAKPASQLVPGLSVQWDRILAKCMAQNPEDRYRSVEEILIALRSLRGRSRRSLAFAVVGAVVLVGVGGIALKECVLQHDTGRGSVTEALGPERQSEQPAQANDPHGESAHGRKQLPPGGDPLVARDAAEQRSSDEAPVGPGNVESTSPEPMPPVTSLPEAARRLAILKPQGPPPWAPDAPPPEHYLTEAQGAGRPEEIARALAHFQSEVGLAPTGTLNPETRLALERSYREPEAQPAGSRSTPPASRESSPVNQSPSLGRFAHLDRLQEKGGGSHVVCLSIDGNFPATYIWPATESLVRIYSDSGFEVETGLFREAFHREGFFERAQGGNPADLRSLDLLDRAERYVFLNVTLGDPRPSGVGEFRTVDGTAQVTVFDRHGHLLAVRSFEVPGAGADDNAARLAAARRLGELVTANARDFH
ncbi:MAG: serine/threonine protein kinase [Candidatus Eisenbacteria sp.]|nr:serine/threonine protein kinase [Candidatus Eisenbacteria bacterium]